MEFKYDVVLNQEYRGNIYSKYPNFNWMGSYEDLLEHVYLLDFEMRRSETAMFSSIIISDICGMCDDIIKAVEEFRSKFSSSK